MPVIPIAAFLTGSLLSLLVPTFLLISLTVWYWRYVARMQGPSDAAETPPPPSEPPDRARPPSA